MSGEHTFGASDDIVRRIRENLPHIQWEQPLSAERERLAADEIERLRAENATLRRNEWRLIWGLCTECGRSRDQEARREQ